MLGKVLGISLVIVSFLHFYLLQNIELKLNYSLKKVKKDEVNFIKLTNYQIKELPKIEPNVIQKPIKEVKQKPKQEIKKIIKKPIKPKKVKKIKKVVKKPIVKKETIKPKEVLKEPIKEEIVEEVETQVIQNIPKVEKVISQKIISKEINIELEKIKTIYANEIRKKIEEYKSYPRVARKLGQEGSVEVKFTILDNGLIKDIIILKPSNYDRLNRATLKTLKEISKFKPIPKELRVGKWDFILPIEFKLN